MKEIKESTYKDGVQTNIEIAKELLATAQEFVVNNPISRGQAADKLKDVNLKIRDTDLSRKRLVKPLNDRVKSINESFKSILEPLRMAQSLFRGKLNAYEAEQERIRKEEQARIEAEKAKAAAELEDAGDTEAAEEIRNEPVPEAKTSVHTQESSSHVRKVWDFEVEDESKIPRKFFVLNESMVKATIRQQAKDGKKPEVPGVRAFQRTSVAVS